MDHLAAGLTVTAHAVTACLLLLLYYHQKYAHTTPGVNSTTTERTMFEIFHLEKLISCLERKAFSGSCHCCTWLLLAAFTFLSRWQPSHVVFPIEKATDQLLSKPSRRVNSRRVRQHRHRKVHGTDLAAFQTVIQSPGWLSSTRKCPNTLLPSYARLSRS